MDIVLYYNLFYLQALENLFAPNKIEDKEQVTHESMAKYTEKVYSLLNRKFTAQKESKNTSTNDNAVLDHEVKL